LRFRGDGFVGPPVAVPRLGLFAGAVAEGAGGYGAKVLALFEGEGTFALGGR
jgi:hypothetical protein